MKHLQLIGRIIYALPFIMFGFGHLTNASMMAGMVPSYFPFAIFWVYISGLGFLAAAIALLINKYASLATLLVGVVLLIFAVLVHAVGMGDQQMGQMHIAMFMKDFALAGAAFFISATLKAQGK
ncbi:MAG: DoxX family protein [Candidatus Kapabacteria bacterium]|nr:DoxX family protein [Candidatus Kapabacteria bacterium]